LFTNYEQLFCKVDRGTPQLTKGSTHAHDKCKNADKTC
jgi:hypothetical protein